MLLRLFCALAAVPAFVHAFAPSDSIQDADPAQSGYLGGSHNMHPATVGSSIFGRLWKNQYGQKEVWYAKPLVFTPNGKKELVFTASNMNYIRTVDAVTGAAINSRLLQPPFLQADIGCGDIPNFIGVTGTPVLDPVTETVYFYSKGYLGGAEGGGLANGRYLFYAVDINTLADKPGFPIDLESKFADNDNARYFIGGTVLQRPSLAYLNGVVIGGFGGHCDLFNYTGMLVAVSTTPGVGVVSMFAMESSPGAPKPQPLDITVQKGGKAGIWQSGMGFATDGSRVFLATGNGQGHANGDVPSSGRAPLSTLDEVVANFRVTGAGKLSLTDYFEPYEYINMDAADRDLGSSGVALLDPTVFKGNGVAAIAVCVGKNGKTYIMDANALGGFKQGPGGTDGVLQTITAGNAVFGGVGSYPLEGGYLYQVPVGLSVFAFKMGLDGGGKPLFTQVGASEVPSAGRVGVGIPTVTTYKGQPGTGILWVTDVNMGLRAFHAVPVNNVLVPIPLPATPGLAKFQRPAFGDSRVYVSDSSGGVYCLGSPVALALACTQPADFGSVAIGSSATFEMTCTAQIALTKVNGCKTSDPTFQCSNSSLPQGPLAKGASFTFPVIWNLTHASISDVQNVSYGHILPGVKGAVLNMYTTNAVAGYSTELPVSLTGTTVSQSAFLSISPQEVDFGGIVVGSPAQDAGLSSAIILSNLGNEPLTFTGYAWDDPVNNNDVRNYRNVSQAPDGTSIIGNAFSSLSFPQPLDTIAVGGSITVPLNFKTTTTGTYSSFLTFWSNGGNQDVLLSGSASTAPIANLSVDTVEGGWDYSDPLVVDFGQVLAGTTATKNLRLCNQGGSVMTITKSKPPTQPELTAQNPLTDFHEGQTIAVNDCALGPIKVPAAFSNPNRPAHTVTDTWTLNADGLNLQGAPWDVHDVAITATITTRQVGVLLPNGTARYQYLGCYFDGGGRQLSKQLSYTAAQQQKNENGQCQKDCFALGYIFAGTQYHVQCWCGNSPPSQLKLAPTDKSCAFSCTGDTTQACGGDGTYLATYYDILRFNPNSGPIPSSSSSRSSTSSTSRSTTSTSRSTTTTSRSTTSTTSSTSQTSSSTSTTSTTSSSAPSSTSSTSSSSSSSSDTSTSSSASSTSSASDTSTSSSSDTSTSSSSDTSTSSTSSTSDTSTSSSTSSTSESSTSSSSSTSDSSTSSTSSSSSTSDSSTSSTSTTSTTSTTSSSVPSSTSSSSSSTISPSSTRPTTSSTSSIPSSTTLRTTTSTRPTTTTAPTSMTTTSVPPPTGWASIGCFVDPPAHALPAILKQDNMNPAICVSAAASRGLKYAFVEYGRECYAGATMPNPVPTSLVGKKACTIPCKGNVIGGPTQLCGGRLQYNLYASMTGSATTVAWTAPVVTATAA